MRRGGVLTRSGKSLPGADGTRGSSRAGIRSLKETDAVHRASGPENPGCKGFYENSSKMLDVVLFGAMPLASVGREWTVNVVGQVRRDQ